MHSELRQLIEQTTEVFIHQVKEWSEIILGFESGNKYELLDKNGLKIGYMAEESPGIMGFLVRQILKSHRPFHIKIWDNAGKEVLRLKRGFFFFFSTIEIFGEANELLGTVNRRFGIFYKKYDLLDERGRLFARVKAPIWRLWTFPIFDERDNEIGVIKKSWGGLLKEAFSDADKFGVSLPNLEYKEKAVTLACAVTIDLDFFEDNSQRH